MARIILSIVALLVAAGCATLERWNVDGTDACERAWEIRAAGPAGVVLVPVLVCPPPEGPPPAEPSPEPPAPKSLPL